jgi:transcriptional regulator with XRE-family HTH domain
MVLGDGGLRPTTAEKQQFARRLRELTTSRGWSQSDLARAAFGSTVDRQGRTVARRRDSISAYLRGRAFPDSKSLAALCQALAVAPQDLAPFALAKGGGDDEPMLEIRQLPNDPAKVWIRLNQLVAMTDALAISAIILRNVAKEAASPAQPGQPPAQELTVPPAPMIETSAVSATIAKKEKGAA